MAYLSHSGNWIAARRRTLASWNWSLILVLAVNTFGWLLIAKLIAQAL